MAIDFPNSPTTNQEFTTAGRTWVYDGAKWTAKTTQGNLVSDSAPATAAQGQIWVNSNTARSYVYLDSTWVEMTNTLGGGSVGANYLINGGFDIWQRGTSITSNTNSYSVDRWLQNVSDFYTTSRQTSGAPDGSQYYVRTSWGANAIVNIYQMLETSQSMALWGKTITFSVKLRRNSSLTNQVRVVIQASSAVDAGVNATWLNVGSTTTYTLVPAASLPTTSTSSSWYTATVTATVPTDGSANSIRVGVDTWDLQPLGATLDIAQAKLEIGNVATSFTRASPTIAAELAACQRFYYRYTAGSFGSGVYYNSTTAYVHNPLPVTMRATPSVAASSSAALTVWSPTGGLNTSSISAWSAGPDGLSIQLGTTTATTGHGCWVVPNGSGYVEYFAEII